MVCSVILIIMGKYNPSIMCYEEINSSCNTGSFRAMGITTGLAHSHIGLRVNSHRWSIGKHQARAHVMAAKMSSIHDFCTDLDSQREHLFKGLVELHEVLNTFHCELQESDLYNSQSSRSKGSHLMF